MKYGDRKLTELNNNAVVTLREITKETVRAICDLNVAENQTGFVAPNSVSIAQAHFEPLAWFRAIYADDTPVGFVMIYDDSEAPEYYLWRFMVDGRYQGLGFGKRGLRLAIEYVKTRPKAKALFTSYVPGEGGPHGFYLKLGFLDTGKMEGIEKEMKLDL
jgi:diamine N-acetyltransferase